MSKKTSTVETVFNVIAKIFMILFLPTVLIIGLFFASISFIIDLISRKDDAAHLSSSETRKRATDRTNARRHSYLEFIVNYLKAIIS